MSWSLVDSGKFDQGGTTTQDFVVTLPTNASGDLCVITAYKDQDLGDWSTASSGWILLSTNKRTQGRDRSTAVFYKILGSSESNPTIHYSNATSDEISWTAHVFRSTDTLSNDFIINAWDARGNQNVQNPTFGDVITTQDNCLVLAIHMQTHDDFTAVDTPPTGFTYGETIWGGTKDNRQQLIAYDLDIGAAGLTSIGAAGNTSNNTISEYSIYTIAFGVQPAINLDSLSTNHVNFGDTGIVASGFGFEASQNSGKLELWDDASGTTKVTQTITSWSDTSITFTSVQGSLDNNMTYYVVIPNDSGDVTSVTSIVKITFGIAPYSAIFQELNPDHQWNFDGDYLDTGLGGTLRPATNGVVNTSQSFVTSITDDATQCMQFGDNKDRREIVDSPYMNITITSDERTVVGWIEFNQIQQAMGTIWKEGGGVQNLAFIFGLGNVVMAQGADNPGNAINAQAVSEIKLTVNRPYHLALRYSLIEDPKELRLFLDGEEQPYQLSNGNPLGAGTFNSHSGDVTWGDSDGNLETGGTDISYNGPTGCKYAYWASWSDNSTSGGAVPKTDILKLFRRGAKPLYTIDSDTETNMQSDLETQLASSEVGDYPLGIRVNSKSGGDDLTLTANDITFNPRTSIQVEWRGSGTLTWIVAGTSDVDESKFYASNGGSVSFVYESKITIEGQVDGSYILVIDSGTKDEIGHIDSSVGAFVVSALSSSVDVMCMKSGKVVIQKFGITVTGNTYVQIVQENDYSYKNPV